LNDITAIESVAYLLKFDSVHGTWSADVAVENGSIVITEGQRREVIGYSCCDTPSKVRRRAAGCSGSRAGRRHRSRERRRRSPRLAQLAQGRRPPAPPRSCPSTARPWTWCWSAPAPS
jgi:hypothetical protein